MTYVTIVWCGDVEVGHKIMLLIWLVDDYIEVNKTTIILIRIKDHQDEVNCAKWRLKNDAFGKTYDYVEVDQTRQK